MKAETTSIYQDREFGTMPLYVPKPITKEEWNNLKDDRIESKDREAFEQLTKDEYRQLHGREIHSDLLSTVMKVYDLKRREP